MKMTSLTVLLLLKIKVYNLQYWRVPNSILKLASGWLVALQRRVREADIYYCNCHNETKHQINAITALFISSMYHSLSTSVHLCRLVRRDINVTFVKHGCSWYSDSNYSMIDVNSSRESARKREREKNACQVMDNRMMSNPRRLLRHSQCLFPHLPNHVTETAFQMKRRKSH